MAKGKLVPNSKQTTGMRLRPDLIGKTGGRRMISVHEEVSGAPPFSPKILKTKEEYEAALAHVAALMEAAPGTDAEEKLELWSLLVERYEQEHYPIDIPDPVEAITFRMEQEGLRQKDLERYFPGKNRVSEVLNHKRPLSIGMILSLIHI